MTDLVSICAPADAPDGAPLLFDRTAPGNCRWGTEETASLIQRVEQAEPGGLPDAVLSAMRALADKVKHLEELTTEMAQQIASQNIRTVGTVERLTNLEAAIGALAEEARKRLEAA